MHLKKGDFISTVMYKFRNLFFRNRRRFGTNFVDVCDFVADVFEGIIETAKNPGILDGLPMGFEKIDSCTSGLKGGQLTVIAARPGIGKTSFAVNIACGLAIEHVKNVVMFSLGMNSSDLVKRMIALGSRVSLSRIRRGQIDSKDKEQIIYAAGNLSLAGIYIDTVYNSVADMLSKTRVKMKELKKRGKTLDLVMVDHIQLVKPDKNSTQGQQVAIITRDLKVLAMELKIPVIAFCQLNCEIEDGEKSGPPRIFDLREAGVMEQDTDIIMFIHRNAEEEEDVEEKYDTGEIIIRRMIEYKLIICKNCNGPVVEQGVCFVPELTIFHEMTSEELDKE
jgi:replicative DNA helicase